MLFLFNSCIVIVMYLVNPTGRVVAIDDLPAYDEWLKKPGFRKATQEEEETYRNRLTNLINSEQREKERQIREAKGIKQLDGIYLATVSQGGKDGYGIASAKIYDNINALGMPISFHNQGQPIGLLFHNPYSIINLENDYLAIFTMFESDKIPDDWIYYLKYADLVIVPSKWCQKVFEKSGIKTTVVPLGYDDTVFKYEERYVKRDKKEVFTFLHFNSFDVRKGFREVFQAFTEEFDKTEPVKLVLKTRLNSIPLPITPAQYPNIEIIKGTAYDMELVNIIKRSDCFVFPSMGEGFGIPPLECMATGMPVIVPNAHGITEYFDPEYMYEAKVEKLTPALYYSYKGVDVGKMVQCDVKQLRSQMRYVYEHQKDALAKGKKASEYVKKWTIKKSSAELLEVLKKLTEQKPKERHVKNVLQLEAV